MWVLYPYPFKLEVMHIPREALEVGKKINVSEFDLLSFFPPCPGLLTVVKSRVQIPVFVMIRPRGGDFYYTEAEIEVMKTDLKVLKEAKADGFVFGFLDV